MNRSQVQRVTRGSHEASPRLSRTSLANTRYLLSWHASLCRSAALATSSIPHLRSWRTCAKPWSLESGHARPCPNCRLSCLLTHCAVDLWATMSLLCFFDLRLTKNCSFEAGVKLLTVRGVRCHVTVLSLQRRRRLLGWALKSKWTVRRAQAA
jgi:hypothetical protein